MKERKSRINKLVEDENDMSLTPDQETMIGEYLDEEFYKKYTWRVGPDDFARVCDTARPGSLQLEPIQDLLITNLNLTRTGDTVGERIPMPELLLRIVQDLKEDVDLARSCGGCRAKVSVTPEGFRKGETFCVLAMIDVLREAGVGVQQLRVALESVMPVGNQNSDYSNVRLCRHGFKD